MSARTLMGLRAITIAGFVLSAQAAAAEMTEQQIIDALKPQTDAPAGSVESQPRIDEPRDIESRELASDERKHSSAKHHESAHRRTSASRGRQHEHRRGRH